MTQLEVTFGHGPGSHWDPCTPSVMLCRLARLQLLDQVSLDFSEFQCADIQLACPFLLPELHKFRLALWLNSDSTRVDLSWLHRQPCRKLTVSICVDTDFSNPHRQLIDQLKQAAVSKLILHLCDKLPYNFWGMWAEVHVSGEVRLEYSKRMFNSASKALQALPCCPRIVIRAGPASSLERQAFYLSGAAIRSHAIKVQLVLSKHTDLHMVGGWPPNLVVLHS